MAAPTPSTGYSIAGVTSVKFGTQGMTTRCVAIDLDQAPEVERYYIENGTGIPATRILLQKGFTWNLTIVDDTNLVPPQIGDAVTMVNIIKDGTIYQYKGTIVEQSARASRKVEGHRVITVESLTLIDVLGAAASPDF